MVASRSPTRSRSQNASSCCQNHHGFQKPAVKTTRPKTTRNVRSNETDSSRDRRNARAVKLNATPKYRTLRPRDQGCSAVAASFLCAAERMALKLRRQAEMITNENLPHRSSERHPRPLRTGAGSLKRVLGSTPAPSYQGSHHLPGQRQNRSRSRLARSAHTNPPIRPTRTA